MGTARLSYECAWSVWDARRVHQRNDVGGISFASKRLWKRLFFVWSRISSLMLGASDCNVFTREDGRCVHMSNPVKKKHTRTHTL